MATPGEGIRSGYLKPAEVNTNFQQLADAAARSGQIGGQILYGGAQSGENLELHSNKAAKNGLIKLGDNSALDEATGKLSIGVGTVNVTPTSGVYVLSSNNDLASAQVRAKNSAAGTAAGGTLQALGDVAVAQIASYCTSNTTSHFGITMAGWSEYLHNAGNGMVAGTLNSTPLVLGTNNVELARLDAAAAAANQTNLLLMEGSPRTSRRVQWKLQSALLAADKVMVLV